MVVKFIIVMILIWLCICILSILGMYLRAEAKHYRNGQAPTVGTYDRHYDLMKQKLKIPDWASIIDLGCGDWWVLRFFAKYYNLGLLAGIDNNLTAIWRWKVLNYLFDHKTINLYHGDIQDIDLSKYDVIYIFLLPKHLDALKSRLQKSINPEAIVICNTFEFSDRKPYQILRSDDTNSVIRIYKK